MSVLYQRYHSFNFNLREPSKEAPRSSVADRTPSGAARGLVDLAALSPRRLISYTHKDVPHSTKRKIVPREEAK